MSLPVDIDENIWGKVRHAFAEALGFDDDEIAFNSKIVEELEAESLDFLDIAFRLEQSFGIKIPRGGIELAAREGAASDGLNSDGTLTSEALVRLAKAMPEVPKDEFVSGLKPADIVNLFRVGTFYYLVLRILNGEDLS